jgi:hypothetical protein
MCFMSAAQNSLLKITLYLDIMRTASIHLAMLLQILQFPVNQQYAISSIISTKW